MNNLLISHNSSSLQTSSLSTTNTSISIFEIDKAKSKWAQRRRDYDRSLEGLPRRRYRDMKARIAGKPQYGDRWKGLELLPLDDFVRWSLYAVGSTYPDLWKIWFDSGYNTLLAPSIDRIDSSKGYIIGNMQWLTRSDHMKRSSAARINGRFSV